MPQLSAKEILDYYSGELVSGQLLENAKNREIVGSFRGETFGKRPNILQYAADIKQMAVSGVTSFHFSVERWSYPMQLVRAENYDSLRTGWDIILDIDSKIGIDEAQAAAIVVCEFLKKNGVKHYGIKFSGSRGFHISLAWEMFPKEIDYKPLPLRYPEIPRVITEYIRAHTAKDIMKELVTMRSAKQLISLLDEPPSHLSPFYFVDIEQNWGARHMFRAPFSLNEKTWLASLPLTYSQLKNFTPDMAKPQSVSGNKNIPEFFSGEQEEAMRLLTDALDWHVMKKKQKEKPDVKKPAIFDTRKIPEELFPPCIRKILSGLADGRKRSIFILANFLRMMNWQWTEIEEKIIEWNERNRPPLPDKLIRSHLQYSRQNQHNPANCPPDGDLYYTSTGVCAPDAICKQGTNDIAIKSPLAYPFKKMKANRKKVSHGYKRGYSCGICNKEFKSMKSLGMHKIRTHDVED